MTIEVSDHGGTKRVRLNGKLDEGLTLVEDVTTLLADGAKRIVLDLSGVPWINSAGLNALVRVTAHANIQEARIVLAAPTEFVSGLLGVTHLDRFFDVSPTVEEAIARLEAPR